MDKIDDFIFNVFAFIMTILVIILAYNHAKMQNDIETGNDITIRNKTYICNIIKK